MGKAYKRLEDLPPGAVVGTSSLRRKAQLLAYRQDLVVRDLRGNVDTRLAALGNGEYDAILLAAAAHPPGPEKPHRPVPGARGHASRPGPSALALEVRQGDDLAEELCYALHHPPSHDRVRAERAFLKGLGAGCLAPVGALAQVAEDGTLLLEGGLFSPDGKSFIRAEIEGEASEAEELGLELARDVLEQGGREILEQTRPL